MHGSSAPTSVRPISRLQLRTLCDSELTELCENYTQINLAVVTTADARLVSCKSIKSRDSSRIAAMVGSLLTLCESLARELSGVACQSIVLSMDGYTCVIVHVAGMDQSLVLAVGVGQNMMLALARRLSLDLAERLSTRLKAFEAQHHLSGQAH